MNLNKETSNLHELLDINKEECIYTDNSQKGYKDQPVH